jgi:CAAX protease family protein
MEIQTSQLQSFIERGNKEKSQVESSNPSMIIKVLLGSIVPFLLTALITGILITFLPSYENNLFLQFFMLIIVSYLILLVFFALYINIVQKKSLNSIISLDDFKDQKSFWGGFLIGVAFPCIGIIFALIFKAVTFVEIKFTLDLLLFGLLAFVGYLISSTTEEIIYRGNYLQEFGKNKLVPIGIFVNSLVFALMHLFDSTFNILWVINLTLFGILASFMVCRKGSLGSASSFHFGWNWTTTVIIGSVNSSLSLGIGYGILNFSFLDSDILNGGVWGIEANIFITIALIIAIIIAIPKKK